MSENEQNFEQLGKLLKLKQHEVPPPGYFNRFSGQVIARIRAGEAAKPQNFAERMQENSSWLANLLRIFDAKPGMIGGFATSMCLLLLLTVVFAERSEQAPKNIFATVGSESATPSMASTSGTAPMLATANVSGGIAVSTNPVTSIQPVATLFGQPASAGLFQQASFAPIGQ
jgi:hypothetical protein